MRTAKRVVREVEWRVPLDVRERTVRTIAAIRATPDAKEGFRAFLERRTPTWRGR